MKDTNSIWYRYRKLEKERRDMMSKLIDQYDHDIYYPALRSLQKECEESPDGHNKARFHDNGLGWTWYYCGKCGASHSKQKSTTAYLDE